MARMWYKNVPYGRGPQWAEAVVFPEHFPNSLLLFSLSTCQMAPRHFSTPCAGDASSLGFVGDSAENPQLGLLIAHLKPYSSRRVYSR